MVIIVGVVVVRNISTADKREHASTGTSRGSAEGKGPHKSMWRVCHGSVGIGNIRRGSGLVRGP